MHNFRAPMPSRGLSKLEMGDFFRADSNSDSETVKNLLSFDVMLSTRKYFVLAINSSK